MIHASVSGTPVASGCEFHVSVFDIFWCLRAFIIVTSGTKWLNILLVVFWCVFVVCFCCRLFLFLSNTASISLSVQDQKPALTTAGDRWGTLWCPDCDGSSSEALLNWRIPPTPQCLPPLMWGLPSLTFYADSTDYIGGGWQLVAWWVCLGGMYVQCLVAQSFIREVCVCVIACVGPACIDVASIWLGTGFAAAVM